jgi:hypothetical protein
VWLAEDSIRKHTLQNRGTVQLAAERLAQSGVQGGRCDIPWGRLPLTLLPLTTAPVQILSPPLPSPGASEEFVPPPTAFAFELLRATTMLSVIVTAPGRLLFPPPIPAPPPTPVAMTTAPFSMMIPCPIPPSPPPIPAPPPFPVATTTPPLIVVVPPLALFPPTPPIPALFAPPVAVI